MTDPDVEIPNRALYKPSEVCEIAKVQPYVLRSWELEFPTLGVARSPGAPRLYRKSDIELVVRIKQLVFGEGLTVAGARRTIEGEGGGRATEPAVVADLVDQEVRHRLTTVRHGLQALLDMLSAGPLASGAHVPVEPVAASTSDRRAATRTTVKAPAGARKKARKRSGVGA